MESKLEKEEEKMRGTQNMKTLPQSTTAKVMNSQQKEMKIEKHILMAQQQMLNEIFDEENC